MSPTTLRTGLRFRPCSRTTLPCHSSLKQVGGSHLRLLLLLLGILLLLLLLLRVLLLLILLLWVNWGLLRFITEPLGPPI